MADQESTQRRNVGAIGDDVNRFAQGGFPKDDIDILFRKVRGDVTVPNRKAAESAIWLMGYGASYIPNAPAVGAARVSTPLTDHAGAQVHLESMLADLKAVGAEPGSEEHEEAMGAFPWASMLPILLQLIQTWVKPRLA
jgi:hypothetical protein